MLVFVRGRQLNKVVLLTLAFFSFCASQERSKFMVGGIRKRVIENFQTLTI
jgi:hypothetical protein